MGSRMEKYDNISLDNMSRTKRNQSVYNLTDISNLSRIKTNTNVSVISNAQKEIDIEKIRNYVYSLNNEEEENRKKLLLEIPEEEEEVVERHEIKDYDINSVLERARDNRESDYEEERHRKISNTQIDILKNIRINDEKIEEEKDPDITEPIEELNTEEKTIVDLIQDIQNHGKKKELFSDLMGDSDDTVVAPIEEEATKNTTLKEELLNMTHELEEIKMPETSLTEEFNIEKELLKNNKSNEDDIKEELNILDDVQELKNEEENNEIEENVNTESITDTKIKKIDKAFYTNSMTFNKTDFEGFEDLENGVKRNNVLTKVAIVFIVILLLATIFLILNFVLGWNIL